MIKKKERVVTRLVNFVFYFALSIFFEHTQLSKVENETN